MTIVLLIAVVVLAGVCVWLAVARGRVAGEAARAQAEAGEASRAAAREREAAEVLRGVEGTLRAALREAEEKLTRLEEQAAADRRLFSEREARLREEQTRMQTWMRDREVELKDAFSSLSAAALEASGRRFAEAAQQRFEAQQKQAEAEFDKRREAVDRLVKPIGETLEQTRARLEVMEKDRLAQFSRIGEQIEAMALGSQALRDETSRLTRALSKPEVRGRYGEIQLRRVAELAGMVDYCDFAEQFTAESADGKLRPDMVVRLPNERVVVVDAKTNIQAYIDAANTLDEGEREAHLDRFARHVSEQAKKLSAKSYGEAVAGAAEFVVMFVPGDQFIDAALSRRPEILEQAAEGGVILASPSTLIGLLRAVWVGWREQRVAAQAAELFELGRELHKRSAKVFESLSEVGDLLGRTTKKYNEAVASIDSRLLPTLRRFEEAGAKSGKELPALGEVTAVPRGG